ncbi:hypothetical protein V495_01308 [Pseudogymnoascus sp. VKM F-4514 (FW-929)]|nr:hypothetical protein V495_01308 [Pseudogymnoascus sp. VKM F-4514 (FW-929)]KFY59234.1 hypothetical protein V497_04458 [Pseudogymnoascus sp. VKM F-4516 (FW-969)]
MPAALLSAWPSTLSPVSISSLHTLSGCMPANKQNSTVALVCLGRSLSPHLSWPLAGRCGPATGNPPSSHSSYQARHVSARSCALMPVVVFGWFASIDSVYAVPLGSSLLTTICGSPTIIAYILCDLCRAARRPGDGVLGRLGFENIEYGNISLQDETMFQRSENNIHSDVFFEVQAPGCCTVATPLDAPTIFTGRPLRGTLLISHEGMQDHAFDVVQLTLEGDVQAVVRHASRPYCEIIKPLILMSCVKVANEFQPVDVGNPHTLKYQTEFFFNIPDFTTLPSLYGKSIAQRLPPSIRVVKSDFISAATTETHNGSSHASTCDITYKIVARVFLDGRLKCNTTREIILMPVEDIPPPLEPEDFGKEYRLVAATSLRLSWRSRKSVTVVISSVEPQPLIFPSCKEGCESTEVLLHLKTRGLLDGSNERAFVEAQLTDCEVRINLEAVTFFSGHEQKAAISIVEALKSPAVVLKKTRYTPNRTKLRLGKWSKGQEIAWRSLEEDDLEAPAYVP